MAYSGTRQTRLIVAIIAAAAAVFSVDLMIELGVACGVTYVGVICLAYWLPERRLIWIVAAGCCVLTILGYSLSPPGGEVGKVLFNRALALFAIGVTTALCHLAKRADRQLRQSERRLQDRVEERTVQLARSAAELQFANQQLQRRAEELEKRTADAESARAWTEAAERRLEEVALHLTLPPRDCDKGNQAFSIGRFSLSDMMICGSAIRGLSHQNTTYAAFARGLVQFLYERFRDEQDEPEFALVRLFRTRRFGELEPSLQKHALAISPGLQSETVCLALVATIGNRPEWCDVSQSTGHQAIPLPSDDAIQRLPMISQLLRQLGLSVAGVLQTQSEVMTGGVETGVFHIPQAKGSPHIPAQQEFVIPFGIQSVVGFGGVLPDGSLCVLIGFAKKVISSEIAQLFSHLSHSTRLALLSYLDVDQKMVAQIRAFDRLLADREEIVADQETRVHQAMAELAHMNEALEQSNLELQQFAYIASHDLQAPLRSMAGFARFLQTEYRGQLDERADDYIERVVGGTKRMQQLIDDLLAYSRVEMRAAPLQPVRLNEVFDDTRTLLQDLIKDSGGEVTRDELPTVSGDRAQLFQLMQNLIGNSIKYRGHDPPQVHASAKPNGSHWTIAVRDNGIGVASEHREKIFEIFHRLHTQQAYPGTGIGLAICRRIVKRHGGSIGLDSQPGQGSTFYFGLKGANS